MPIVRIYLDVGIFDRLAECAIEECRPIPWQAEVMLRRALGMPPSVSEVGSSRNVVAQQEGASHVHQPS